MIKVSGISEKIKTVTYGRSLSNLTAAFLSVLILLSTGCVTIYNPATQRKEYYFIDDKSEITIGKNAAEDIIKKNNLVHDKRTVNYVNKIGKSLAAASDRPNLEYHFYVLDDKEINAFALPGGYIFVNKGLADNTNADEIAFVLGHEIGHVCARHSVKRLQVSLGFNLLMSIALRNPNQDSMKKAMDTIYGVVSLGYSRQDEYLADSLGIKYSNLAGYDTAGAISLLEKLNKEKKSGHTPVFLSSHPLPEQRIENARKTIASITSGIKDN